MDDLKKAEEESQKYLQVMPELTDQYGHTEHSKPMKEMDFYPAISLRLRVKIIF